jgi:hypothetical protein
LLKGVNVTAICPAAAVSGNEKCSLVEQRIAMEAAWASIQPCIVRPHFFSCFLVQRIKLACTGSNEEKVATDRGL